MKSVLRLICFIFLLSNFQTTPHSWLITKNKEDGFSTGENLTYNVHYGWLDAGTVHMLVDPDMHTINEKNCYKIDVAGESKGVLYLFLKMKNYFCTYLDKDSYLPQMFYRDIQEGKYTKKEKMFFNHDRSSLIVEQLSVSTHEITNTATFTIGNNVQDIASIWYVLRKMDFSPIQVGDILYSPMFFDNTLYEKFQTKFLGRKTIKTKIGYIDTLVLAPLVPFSKGNSIFAGENSVELYLSDDNNKIPVKIKIKLLVGAVEIDLINYKKLQYPLGLKGKVNRKKGNK